MSSPVAKPLKFAISYGLVCGPLNSRRLRKHLAGAGFKPIDLGRADIIIAHSAGCWLMQPDLKPKLVVYVGMPLNSSGNAKIWRQMNSENLHVTSLKQTLKTVVFSIYYGLRQPMRNWNIINKPKVGKPTIYSNAKSVFIANRNDPWPKSNGIEEFVGKHDNWTFLSLDGGHDTLWEHPEEFIEVIKIYAARLLA